MSCHQILIEFKFNTKTDLIYKFMHQHEPKITGKKWVDVNQSQDKEQRRACVRIFIYLPYKLNGTVDDMKRGTITNQCLSKWRDYSNNKLNNL